MAHQTAWSTEYFDDRPLEYKAQVETAAAASPRTAAPVGIPPPMYTTGNSNSAAGRNTGSGSSFVVLVCILLVPRVLQVIFLIIAMSLTAAIPGFTAFSSLKFLLSLHVIALVYSLAVLVWVIICLVSGNSQFRRTGLYITFILDLLLACTLLAADTAAAVVTVDVDGRSNCGSPCLEQSAAISMGTLAINFLVFSARISRLMMQSTTAVPDVAEQSPALEVGYI
ncbi:unnamed protein product [Sphagnum jensenii]|uniref:CASP-like protein n=1 Tax=Sphagnum jensenii TaxID=128206 RepID=A0ABP1AHF5_9BRYO